MPRGHGALVFFEMEGRSQSLPQCQPYRRAGNQIFFSAGFFVRMVREIKTAECMLTAKVPGPRFWREKSR
jgi:hypothetical protein